MAKVLLVEDNRILKIAQERLLTKAGHEVIYAADGEEALWLLTREQPDVIILDMMLPKLSGPDVLRRIKSDPLTARIPVIVVTSLSQRNEQKLREDGAAAFFEKGKLLDAPEPLLRTIARILKQAQKPVDPSVTAETTPQANLET